MELYNKLNRLVKQYCYNVVNINIKILTDEKDSEIINYILKNYKNASISKLVDEYETADIIIIYYNGKVKQYNDKIVKLINEYIERKKVFMLIVTLEFDFDYIVKNVNANSIDAISWHDDNGKKNNEYIIVIKKN